MDSLSDKQTTKGLALTIGILVLVMLALILVSNIL
jgi:Tfp pilus assembly protein PilX